MVSTHIFAHLAVADLRITGHLRFCPNKACSSPRYTCVVALFPGQNWSGLILTYITICVCHTYTALFWHIKKGSIMCSHNNCQKFATFCKQLPPFDPKMCQTGPIFISICLHILQGVPRKKLSFRMLLELQCTGSITCSWQPLCLEINFLVVSYLD